MFKLKNIPNFLTLMRILLIPVIIVFMKLIISSIVGLLYHYTF